MEDVTDKAAHDAPSGLTDAEVAERVAEGRSNANADLKTKPVWLIVCQHVCTLFNAVNLLLAVLVISTGSFRNLLFVWVVIANLGIGIFQEIRSKMVVDKLSIIAARKVRVIRSRERREVAVQDIVLDDLIELSHGDQVPADAIVCSGVASMNESLLTGESVPVGKSEGDQLMSGSFVDSGSLVAKVVRVGAESYAARINSEAKYIKKVNSEIMGTLNMIIRFATYLLGPLGVGLYLRTIATGSVTTDAVLTTVAALVGMIPQGLVLLTSTVLAIATIRLARSKVLVQQLYCIETLARVDVLCLDKTGTITSGHMEVQKVVDSALGDDDAADVETSISTIAHGLASDANETSNAILTYVDGRGVKPLPVARTIPFSSARKYSGCVCSNGRALVMGAAQFVLGEGSGAVGDSLRTLGERTRVLVVCEADGFDDDLAIKGEARLLGFVAIQDEIRRSASDTISFFKKQGVDLKIISGDDPVTVSAIASKVGVPHAERYVDASELDTPGKLFDAVSRYSVFGRVTPAQKRELVKAIKSQGHTVAMTGDGVNDVLALKEADCSVAMASGSDAARNVAEIVLVDNDFAHMPEVVAEGRRSINNLQRSASLFLVKTVFSAALALVCIVNPPYPFLPIQMSLISASIIGIPSFVLALEPNHERVTGNFLGNVLARSLPASVVISVVVGLATCTSGVMGLDFGQTSTLCTLLTALIGLALIARISRPMNPLRLALLFVSAGTVLIGCTLLKGLFEVSELNLQMWVFLVVAGGLGLIVFNLLYDRGTAAVCDEGGYSRFMRSLEEKHGRNRS